VKNEKWTYDALDSGKTLPVPKPGGAGGGWKILRHGSFIEDLRWLRSLREKVRRQVVRFRGVFISHLKDLGRRSTCGTRLDTGRLSDAYQEVRKVALTRFHIKPESEGRT
jgi:hypothetical protein